MNCNCRFNIVFTDQYGNEIELGRHERLLSRRADAMSPQEEIEVDHNKMVLDLGKLTPEEEEIRNLQ